ALCARGNPTACTMYQMELSVAQAMREDRMQARADPCPPLAPAAPTAPEPGRPSATPQPGGPVALTPLPIPPNLHDAHADLAIRRFRTDMIRIVGKVVSERDYPRLARDRNWQGSTMVRVEVGPDGLLKGVTVTKSSGYSVLDDRAVSRIREISLPNIPDELRE